MISHNLCTLRIQNTFMEESWTWMYCTTCVWSSKANSRAPLSKVKSCKDDVRFARACTFLWRNVTPVRGEGGREGEGGGRISHRVSNSLKGNMQRPENIHMIIEDCYWIDCSTMHWLDTNLLWQNTWSVTNGPWTMCQCLSRYQYVGKRKIRPR